MLPVLEGVHAYPEPVVAVANQLLLTNQSLEWFLDKIFFLPDVIEDLLLEDEKASVNPHRRVTDRLDSRNKVASSLCQGNHVVAQIGADAEKTRDLVLLVEVVQLLRKMQIGQTIAVICQKFLVAVEMFLNGSQALANVRVDSRVGECDLPVIDVAIEQLQFLAAARQDKIVGDTLVVIEKVVLHYVRPIAQAENEVFVPEVGIVLHHMPQNRAVADLNHRLRDVFRVPDP